LNYFFVTNLELNVNTKSSYEVGGGLLLGVLLFSYIFFYSLIITWCQYLCNESYLRKRAEERRHKRRFKEIQAFPMPTILFPPLPSASFPPRSESVVEVEVDIHLPDTPHLLTATENHLNECRSPSLTSLPPYDIAVMDQQLSTYKEVIVLI